MASLVLKMSVSLDGYVAPADGSSDWAAAGRSDDGASWTLETVSNAATHLIGAATPDRPGRGRAALHHAADHRAHQHHRLQPRSRRPRLRGAPVIERQQTQM
jgi:hypothetical protein